MKKKLLLIGIGGHSRSCIDVIESTQEFEIVGYVDKNLKSASKETHIRFLGYDSDLPNIFKEIKYAHIAVGQMKNLDLRKNLFNKLVKIGFKLPKIISKKSIVSKNNIKIGDGTIIMHNALINSNVNIKENCIINTGSILNGGVEVGKQSFIGSGSVIKQKTKIRNKSFYPMLSKIWWKIPITLM